MTADIEAMLHEFHTRPGCDIELPSQPTLDIPGLWARMRYLDEELRELKDALANHDLIGFADALGDISYLLYGTAERTAIPLNKVIAEIHLSNMSKTPSPGDGKAIKGPGYRKPNLIPILFQER